VEFRDVFHNLIIGYKFTMSMKDLIITNSRAIRSTGYLAWDIFKGTIFLHIHGNGRLKK
jgi:hypothetical protein